MAPHIFLTGATGYIGGTTLSHLVKSQPGLSPTITALVRTPQEASTLQKAHPGIRTVLGDLDSHDLLCAEAAKANLVLNAANTDHEAGVLAILEGLGSKQETSVGKGKGVFVHVSGAASLVDLSDLDLGNAGEKIWSDAADSATILSFPPERIHAQFEQKVVTASEASGVNTVILSPATILGAGTGTGKTESFGEEYPRAVLKYGSAFVLGDGRNLTSWSSVGDVASAITVVIQEALHQPHNGRLSFGKHGYYFIASGEIIARERAEFVGEKLKAQGKLKSKAVVEIDAKTVAELHPYGVLMWGVNVRSRAEKLRGLGWEPKEREWRDLVGESVEREVGRV